MTKRKRYSTKLKATLPLEAICEELTTAELAKKYDIHLHVVLIASGTLHAFLKTRQAANPFWPCSQRLQQKAPP
ncbi:hypothetical protein [Paracoccus aerius]|uniref:Transposase n=1 Tax=Paracoccus aerius TaxID=1915382 RepID=A0ABS1S8I5_9RHOB|nr:hypothetical protein [Paracoccus aerius]MBL3675028.1 hypothetical protein [Paracoccus aerius]